PRTEEQQMEKRAMLVQRFENYARLFGHFEGPEFFYSYAQIFSEPNELDKKIAYVQRSLDVDPDFVPALKMIGEHQLTQGHYAEALKNFTRLAETGLELTDDTPLLQRIVVCAHHEDERSVFLKAF